MSTRECAARREGRGGTPRTERELRRPLLYQHWRERDFLEVVAPAKVVDQVGGGHQVESSEAAVARGVVVVTVDREDGQLHVVVGVLKVDALILGVEVGRLIGHHLDLHLSIAKAVVAHDLHRTLQRLARGLVLVKEIAREEDHVDFVRVRQLEALGKRHEAVLATCNKAKQHTRAAAHTHAAYAWARAIGV